MGSQWLFLSLTLLTWGQLGVSLFTPYECPVVTDVCYHEDVAKLRPESSGQYFAVGGLFDIHSRGEDAFTCGTEMNPAGILHTQAFLWSLDYWQTDSSVVSIGAVVFDNCERKAQMIQNVLGFEQCNIHIEDISRHNLVGFVGPTENMAAMAAAKLTGDMHLTLISPAADGRWLSNGHMYPYFLRTTPTIQMDVDIMTFMLTHIGTEFVAVIYEESLTAALHSFQHNMEESGICISGSYPMTGHESSEQLMEFIRGPLATLEPTRFIVLLVSPEFLEHFLACVSLEEEVRSLHLVFLMTSQIRLNSNIFRGQHAVTASDAIILERAEPDSDEVQEAVRQFKNYWHQDTILDSMEQRERMMDPFLEKYLSEEHSLPEFDVDAAYTIVATRAFVEGMKRAGRDACGANANNYLCPAFLESESRGSALYETIRSVTGYFTGHDNDGNFANGDLRDSVVRYNIYRYNMNGTFTKIGEYAGGDTPTLTRPLRGDRAYNPGHCQDNPCPQCPHLTTPAPPDSSTLPPHSTTLPPCPLPEGDVRGENFSRVFYPHDQEITGAFMLDGQYHDELETRFAIGQRWIIALGVLAGLGILAVLVFEVYILYKLLGTRLSHRWSAMWLGQLLLFSVFLCYLTLFAYLFVPTRETCGITRFGVGVSCSMCFGILLVKLMVILTAKGSDSSSQMPGDDQGSVHLKGVYQFLMFMFVVGVQVVIDAQWLISVPPEAVKVWSNTGEETWVCNHFTYKASRSMSAMMDMSEFVRTDFENHVISLVYVMVLILITTLLALKARGIVSNHHEGVFIGVAAGFCIPIWLAWTLVGGFNKDDDYAHEFGDACTAFGLFSTATLILFAMFLPKARQLMTMGSEGIYFDDDRDTLYGGSVIMAPSYKAPNSVIYVNSHGDPLVLNNGDGTYARQPSVEKPALGSMYSAPPGYQKKGGDSVRGANVLRVTDDLSGKRPLEKKVTTSDVGYRSGGRARSARGTINRSKPQSEIGAL